MPEKVDAWKCAFCSRCYMKKCTAVIHENACKKNPDRHHCATCVHGIMVDYHVVVESQYPEEHGYGGPMCAYHEKPIRDMPYFQECDTTGGPYEDEYPMPGTCWNYEYKGRFGWTPEDEYAKDHPEYKPQKPPDDDWQLPY